MNELATHDLTAGFRNAVQAFLDRTGTAPARLGIDAAGDPSFVARLRRGASPRLDTVARVRAWMAAHCGVAEGAAIRAASNGDIDYGKRGDDFMKKPATDYLTTRVSAAHLGLSARTLERYRVSGEGPVFLRFGGRVRYLREDLDSWAKTRRRKSTSDDGGTLAAPDTDPGAGAAR